mgnify:CR=1 FL=1
MYIKDKFLQIWNTKNYIKKLTEYSEGFKTNVLILTGLNTLNYLLGISLAVLSKHVIDGVTKGFNSNLLVLFSFYALVIITMVILSSYTSLYQAKFSERLTYKTQSKFLSDYYNVPWSKTNQYMTGDIVTRLTSDTSKIITFYSKTIPVTIALFLQLIVAFIIVINYNLLIGLYGFIIMPLVGLISIVFGKKMKTYQNAINKTEGQYRSFMNEAITNDIIIRSFEQENNTLHSFKEIQQRKYNIVLKKLKTVIVSNFAIQFGYNMSSIIAFGWGAYQISLGTLTVGTFFAIIQLLARMQSPIMKLTKMLPQYISTVAAVDRLEPFRNYNNKNKTTSLIPNKLGIKINKLVFSYNSETIIIKDLTTNIKPGESIAIVGYSGIGKTTLMRLLMGLLEPNSGLIQPYHDSHIFDNHAGFYSYVPQGNTLFSGTIKSNLLMGKDNASESELYEALENACAKDFVESLPNKLATELGESGHGLSEGQLQRICIARALLREAPVLLLDEATSALDQKTETNLLKNICENYPDKTLLAITHRPSLITFVDRVIELCYGQIIQSKCIK